MKILHSLIMESKISLVITGINSVPSKKTMKIDGLITLTAQKLPRVILAQQEKVIYKSVVTVKSTKLTT